MPDRDSWYLEDALSIAPNAEGDSFRFKLGMRRTPGTHLPYLADLVPHRKEPMLRTPLHLSVFTGSHKEVAMRLPEFPSSDSTPDLILGVGTPYGCPAPEVGGGYDTALRSVQRIRCSCRSLIEAPSELAGGTII